MPKPTPIYSDGLFFLCHRLCLPCFLHGCPTERANGLLSSPFRLFSRWWGSRVRRLHKGMEFAISVCPYPFFAYNENLSRFNQGLFLVNAGTVGCIPSLMTYVGFFFLWKFFNSRRSSDFSPPIISDLTPNAQSLPRSLSHLVLLEGSLRPTSSVSKTPPITFQVSGRQWGANSSCFCCSF